MKLRKLSRLECAIRDAWIDGERMLYGMARRAFPPKVFPRAWNAANKGGPCAWTRPLKKALNRLGIGVDDSKRLYMSMSSPLGQMLWQNEDRNDDRIAVVPKEEW